MGAHRTSKRRLPDCEPFLECVRCGNTYHISLFYDVNGPRGRYKDSSCKKCRNEVIKAYKNSSQEKRQSYLEYHREYWKTYKRK